jgi:hypothetical protein
VTHRFAEILMVALLALPSGAQTSPSPGDPPKPTPTPLPPTGTVEQAAPDAPVPDLGNLPTQREKPKSVPQKIARKLKDAAPTCLDAIIHTCWAQPSAGDGPTARAPEDVEYLEDIEVGDFNFKSRNYSGAVLRYREALVAKANDPEATYKLALSLERARKNDEARCTYQAFLNMGPHLPFAANARKALDRLKAGKEPGANCPELTHDIQKSVP